VVSKRGNSGPTRKADDMERPATPVKTLPFIKVFDIILAGTSAFCVLYEAAGMTQEHRLALIIKTIQELKAGIPVSIGRMTLLLEPWPDLYRNAMARRGVGWINLLQAAAARIEFAPE
jgi:hypothetical protein